MVILRSRWAESKSQSLPTYFLCRWCRCRWRWRCSSSSWSSGVRRTWSVASPPAMWSLRSPRRTRTAHRSDPPHWRTWLQRGGNNSQNWNKMLRKLLLLWFRSENHSRSTLFYSYINTTAIQLSYSYIRWYLYTYIFKTNDITLRLQLWGLHDSTSSLRNDPETSWKLLNK